MTYFTKTFMKDMTMPSKKQCDNPKAVYSEDFIVGENEYSKHGTIYFRLGRAAKCSLLLQHLLTAVRE